MEASFTAEKLRDPTIKRGLRLPHLEISAVWIRFLLAIGGLILAFVAALFSTVSRQAGNLWGTLVLASVALLLAVFVGITTVPYLAKRIAAGRIRNAVDYKVTKLGLIYVTIVVMIGIAALNTGNNLLYIVVAAMLAAILVSGVVSAIVLRDLELDVRIPEHVFAGETIRARSALANTRRWLPSFSVSVVSFNQAKKIKQWQWKATTFAFPPRRPPQKQWLTLPDRKLQRIARAAKSNCIFSGTTYFPYIPPRNALKADLDLTFTRRGRYKEESFGLASGFPFNFLIKTRHVPMVREIIVYPSVQHASDHIELFSNVMGEFETFLRGGDDFYRLREYMPGDSARHLDWKATAKTGELKVREFSREDNRKLRIIFDNPNAGLLPTKKYEDAVSKAAALAWHFEKQNIQMSYLTESHCGVDIHAFLNCLATVEPAGLSSILESIEATGEFNVIITARSSEEIPAHLGNCSYVMFVGPTR